MSTTSYAVDAKTWLVSQDIDANQSAKQVDVPTNHLVVIDCSGSMYGELPKIREQLKSKLPKMMREGDTISIIWFSGRGEFGTLLEAEPVATLKDLKDVNAAIDRWLKPIGLTGFKEPLVEASALIDRVAKKTKGATFSLFFLSDGCDNQWSRADILNAVETAAGKLASATFVEYGYYADRPLLTAMAEKAGGALIFAEDFTKFEPVLTASLQKKALGGPRVEVKVEGEPVRGFVWSMHDGDLVTYAVEDGKVRVPPGTKQIWYVSPQVSGKVGDGVQVLAEKSQKESGSTHGGPAAVGAAYAALSLFAVRMAPDVVLPFLKATGDVAFIEQFGGLFGKQAYSQFMDAAKAAAFDMGLRWQKGFDPSKVPAEDAFTVLDVLKVLHSDEQNRLLLDSPDFVYNRIGRARLDSSENLTVAEQEEIQELTKKIASERNAVKVKEYSDRIAQITQSKQAALKFESSDAPDGYHISNLTYNEERPNVSVLVKRHGTVDLSGRLPDSLKGKVPEKFPTFIYRNYAIVKDGLVNVQTLPVKLSDATHQVLDGAVRAGKAPAAAFERKPDGSLRIDLSKLPVINRQMVKGVSAKEFFKTQWQLLNVQAAQKIYNAAVKDMLPEKKSEGFAFLYGDEAAAWLKEQGITDYSGFSPKSTVAAPTDMYMAKELKVSIKGYSSFPSMKQLTEQVKKGKLNGPGALMKPYLDELNDFMASDVYKKSANPQAMLETWVKTQLESYKKQCRRLIYDISQVTFCVIVGQTWFTDFSSLDENSMTLDLSGNTIEFKADLREYEEKI